MIAETVHTTGINVDGLLANVVSILIIVGFFTGIIIRLVKRSIGDEVAKAIQPILKRLDEHDTRLARLEGVEEGKRQAVAQASVSANPGPVRTV